MRTSVRIGVKALAVLFVAGIAGQALARRRTVGDEASDEFDLAVYFGGVDRGSTATALRPKLRATDLKVTLAEGRWPSTGSSREAESRPRSSTTRWVPSGGK